MTRSINAEGLSHIKKFEGLRPEPIEDVANSPRSSDCAIKSLDPLATSAGADENDVHCKGTVVDRHRQHFQKQHVQRTVTFPIAWISSLFFSICQRTVVTSAPPIPFVRPRPGKSFCHEYPASVSSVWKNRPYEGAAVGSPILPLRC